MMSATSRNPSVTKVNGGYLYLPETVLFAFSVYNRDDTVEYRSTVNQLHLHFLLAHNSPFFQTTGSSDAGSWTPYEEDGGEEDVPDTPESLPPYPSNGE